MKLVFLLLTVITGVLAAAPQISVNIDGTNYQCGVGGGGGCQNNPAIERCDDWNFTGSEKLPYPKCPSSFPCVEQNVFQRECRVFNGCGNLTAQFTQKKQEIPNPNYLNCNACY